MPPRRAAAYAAGAFAFVYALAAADVVLRARDAYMEGEKYLRWSRDPAAKAVHFDAELARKTALLKKDFDKARMTAPEFEQRVILLKFERDSAVSESSLKYAYVWFQTAVELFTPPESRWIAKSRRRMAEVKELWKAELRAKKIPFEEYMLE